MDSLKEAFQEMKMMDITEEDWDSDFIDKARLGKVDAVAGLSQLIIDKEDQIEELAEFNRLKDEAKEREEKEGKERLEAAEKKKREENEQHRNKIHARIADAIHDLDKGLTSIDLVMEIADGNIPHLKIEY